MIPDISKRVVLEHIFKDIAAAAPRCLNADTIIYCIVNMVDLNNLTVGYVSGIIAAAIFVGRQQRSALQVSFMEY